MKINKAEKRTPEQLRDHYEIEKELANKLRNASKEERRSLYMSVYDEMYRRVPLNPVLTKKITPEAKLYSVNSQMRFLKPFLNKDTVFLEVGAGECSLSLEVVKYVKQVYAVDVSSEVLKNLNIPNNFSLLVSDGCSIPVPVNSVNVAYSNQLMEHLHPDDAYEQLQNICKALASGGIYICITPNALNGPHDISKYFGEVAEGFHLKEYTITELQKLFKQAGFSKVKSYIGGKGIFVSMPLSFSIFCESVLKILPYKIRKSIAGSRPFKVLLGIKLVGIK